MTERLNPEEAEVALIGVSVVSGLAALILKVLKDDEIKESIARAVSKGISKLAKGW